MTNIDYNEIKTNYLSFIKSGIVKIFAPHYHNEVTNSKHVEILSSALQDLTESKTFTANNLIKKGFITPPHHTSAIGNVLYAMWLIGNNPNEKIRVIVDDEMLERWALEKYSAVANSEIYKQIFPNIHFNITQKEISVIDDLGVKQNGVISIHTRPLGMLAGIDATTIIFDVSKFTIDDQMLNKLLLNIKFNLHKLNSLKSLNDVKTRQIDNITYKFIFLLELTEKQSMPTENNTYIAHLEKELNNIFEVITIKQSN